MEKQEMGQLIHKLQGYATTELCDGSAVYNAMDYRIQCRISGRKIVGPALTVKLPYGEGQFVMEAIRQAKPGDILVLAGQGNEKTSLWGDFRSFCARKKGIAGVVIDGLFRDYAGCKEEGVPIYAFGCTCGTAVKVDQGELQVPVSCGGVVVHPGDLIVGDENGVCVIPIEQAEAILERAEEKIAAGQKRKQEWERRWAADQT